MSDQASAGLFPVLETASSKLALSFPDRSLSYAELAAVAGGLANSLRATGASRVAVWATSTLETSVGVVAALLAGVPVVPVNPKIGERELAHIVADSAPALVLAEPAAQLPPELAALPRHDVDLSPSPVAATPEPNDAAPAVIVYTSGTTGLPKGVVLTQGAIAATLDAVADIWQWTDEDVLVHALPLFHVHGLILGILGPLRRGGSVRHLGRFDTAELANTLADDGTMLFGVPTMYHRIALEVADAPALAAALRGARLLVSGSAALPVTDHQRIFEATGQHVVERYGMSETLMNTSVPARGPAKPGTVGVPLHGVELRLVDEAGTTIDTSDGETVGEIHVRGPNLFTEYLNRPDATAAAFVDGWFATGDVATRDSDGYIRIVGRKATDIIKSGGYKIGAGEIENALLEHPAVAEVAVTGEPDDDLGERIVAWVVPDGTPPTERELADHVARLLTPHKRPRVVRFQESLPRNDMGKVMKRALHG
ncbi:malonyl-CoA/methylmalonyl-CoA synthetase [Tamaricihabitans halophyticus]|uniref:Malonyl-CoA/methylmalonyl-CoA synthetase n=1 Tax=Tamaricihabitans halophyticus TaxID=1262583 RepID=A0A4R2Q9Z6_9PSEU|nr:acyl-CoA synthetase [Tamaricihabitans halophyticus]TCP45753.1 malonyl-CoA/methylmalonyl-CoA synthetase [Tamaricihabitans halophyticus]